MFKHYFSCSVGPDEDVIKTASVHIMLNFFSIQYNL
jgi:hypothetical protein